ncbi:MAG: HlyD family efflux transporter periplasmic adaptor subunit [Anaerolineales bacterium]|nr:HlyD family efflux transporter periplasmic adaptor subunit [Anaerolineales bacterium]
MKGKREILLLVVLILLLTAAAGCDSLMAEDTEALHASGVIEVVEVVVSAETGGRVSEVFASEGDMVVEGDPLLLMEDELLDAALSQMEAGLDASRAQLESAQLASTAAAAAEKSAEAGLEMAQIEYEAQLAFAREAAASNRTDAWVGTDPAAFDLPPWYFNQGEEIAAAVAELEAAQDSLAVEQANYDRVIQDASNADIVAAEERLAQARAAFLVAEELRDRRLDQQDRDVMEDYIRVLYDSADAELDNAQKDYDRLLSDQSAKDVLEARARLAVSQERVETALDLLQQLRTGEQALPVQLAAAGMRQAEALLDQAKLGTEQAEAAVNAAEKLVAQAEAAMETVKLQQAKLSITAPVSGTVLTRGVEQGELLQPGMAAFMIGRMEEMTITVYLPEDQYGRVGLNDRAQVTVDSFPDITFEASVVRIADEAEYTPRNVQTEEDRRTTVYAVKLDVTDPENLLKPGMPADVVFFAE